MRTSRRFPPVFVAVVTLVVLLVAPASPAPATPRAGAAPEMGSSDWRSVSGGGFHSCGLRTAGRLFCWGNDDFGQLGNDTGGTQTTPGAVLAPPNTWVAVSAGGFHTCGLRANGRLYCWGRDTWGQLGDGGTSTDAQVPVQVAGNRTDWRSVDAGYSHTCATRTSGRLFCWGYDGQGMVGDGGANLDRQAPTPVAGGATDWLQVSAGGQSTCGLRAPGRLYCWGDDAEGQLGDDNLLADQTAPAPVGSRTDWRAVSVGGYHACATRTTGALYCWGDDAQGQVGDGVDLTDRPRPAFVKLLIADRWAGVAAGGQGTCARTAGGHLFCWGDDSVGQVGDDVVLADQPVPAEVAGAATDWTAVSGGDFHACARITSGRLFCWGANATGQVGTQVTGAFHNLPVPVAA